MRNISMSMSRVHKSYTMSEVEVMRSSVHCDIIEFIRIKLQREIMLTHFIKNISEKIKK